MSDYVLKTEDLLIGVFVTPKREYGDKHGTALTNDEVYQVVGLSRRPSYPILVRVRDKKALRLEGKTDNIRDQVNFDYLIWAIKPRMFELAYTENDIEFYTGYQIDER